MSRLSRVKYANSVIDTIGRTPLVKLNNVARGIEATVLAKAEYFNPGGSVKDRIGVRIVADAVEKGRLKPGGTIVECTSGNTGAGLALIAAVHGYKAVFTMPDKMSTEKIRLLKSYGAEVIVCPTAVPPESPESYYSVARRIADATPNAIFVNQYFNLMNPEAHYLTTGPEIWEDTSGEIDYFVCSIGTGGTISGTGRYLKEKSDKVKIVGVDPVGSILCEYFYTRKKGEAHPYLVEGIGEDIIPDTFQPEYIDDIITVGDRESFAMARRLSREEGLFVGGSCGTAVQGALEIARGLDKDKIVVVLLPDSGERYLSKFHSDEWMRENRMLEPDTATRRDVEKATVGHLVTSKIGERPAVVSVEATDTVAKALERMKQFGITQLPVRSGDDWVGKVTEHDVMDHLLRGDVTSEQTTDKVMSEPFPVIDADESYSRALKLFSKRNLALLVRLKDGWGIITKSDVVDDMLHGIE